MKNIKVPFIDLKLQYLSIKDEVNSKFREVLKNQEFILDEEVKRFEEEFAKYCKVNYCIGVASGTDALILGMKSLGITRGDEVITVANTFIATVEAITHVGARPVFVDIDPLTYNINPNKIEEKITDKTKAIIPVHLYGQPTDMDPIIEFASKHDLFIIEDAAQAHGAKYKGRKVGSFGNIACFSFYPAKNLGAYGDAGAIVTNDEEIVEILRKLRNHGSVKKYQHDIVGYNSRLDTLQAAVLRIKLKYLEKWNSDRQKNAKSYNEFLSKIQGVITPKTLDDATHVYHLYVVRLKNDRRDELRRYLQDKGIATGIHYPTPVHLTKAFEYIGYREGDFPAAEESAKKIVSLPIYPELQRGQIEFISQEIQNFLER